MTFVYYNDRNKIDTYGIWIFLSYNVGGNTMKNVGKTIGMILGGVGLFGLGAAYGAYKITGLALDASIPDNPLDRKILDKYIETNSYDGQSRYRVLSAPTSGWEKDVSENLDAAAEAVKAATEDVNDEINRNNKNYEDGDLHNFLKNEDSKLSNRRLKDMILNNESIPSPKTMKDDTPPEGAREYHNL